MNMEEDKDTGLVAVWAVRYCMGRMTYAPSTTVDWLKRHWSKLPVGDRACIFRDVKVAVEEGKHLGMDCDVKLWTDFLKWMQDYELQI